MDDFALRSTDCQQHSLSRDGRRQQVVDCAKQQEGLWVRGCSYERGISFGDDWLTRPPSIEAAAAADTWPEPRVTTSNVALHRRECAPQVSAAEAVVVEVWRSRGGKLRLTVWLQRGGGCRKGSVAGEKSTRDVLAVSTPRSAYGCYGDNK